VKRTVFEVIIPPEGVLLSYLEERVLENCKVEGGDGEEEAEEEDEMGEEEDEKKKEEE
jgi:hypothetical protein